MKYTIKDAVSGNEYICRDDESIFRAMHKSGRSIFIGGCEGGGCGICKVKILEGDYVKFKNRSGGDMEYRLIRRDLLHDEAEKILTKQSGFYRCLTRQNIERTLGIMFAQRDFEDGPGDPNDKDRRYQGFIEKLGKCPFCKDEDRGFRGTVLSDVFAVTNTLSQYRFVSKETGEYCLDKNVAEEIVDYLRV